MPSVKLRVSLPKTLSFSSEARKARAAKTKALPREAFFDWAWTKLVAYGLEGVHEGTVLAQDADLNGEETEGWVLDAGIAPQNRDWVKSAPESEVELYFASKRGAERALEDLKSYWSLSDVTLEEVPDQDWDAEWKKSFLNMPDGLLIEPCWSVIPPWHEKPAEEGRKAIRINPGAGFGTGTHETTQLCLQTLGDVLLARERQGQALPSRALDFGSGSGILSVASALWGISTIGVEIDPLANENAVQNAILNQVSHLTHFYERFEDIPKAQDLGRFELVFANILRPILIEFAPALLSRLSPGGTLILSGLIESDVPLVIEAYQAHVPQGLSRPEVRARGDWRSLTFQKSN